MSCIDGSRRVLFCPFEAAVITVAVIYGAHMKRRDKGSNGEVGGEVEIFSTGRGVLVEGNPSDVSVFIDQMLAVTREAGGQSRHLVVDGAQLAANVVAFRQTHREYFEFSDRARKLLTRHGVIPAKENGYNRSFVKRVGKYAGNLDWKKIDLGPEQALSMQAMAGQMALKAAIKEVVTAIERVEGKVDDLARMAKSERLGAVFGDRSTLLPLVERVVTTGKLSSTDWDTVASLGSLIARDIAALRSYVLRQLSEIEHKSLVRARAEQAEELSDELLKESIALLVVAEQNYALWQQLRLAHSANHEKSALEAVTHDIRDQLEALERADQHLVDKLLAAIRDLTTPTGYEGLAPLQKRKLRQHSDEIEATTKWFANQRHLDYSSTAQHEFANLRDSLGKLGETVMTKTAETRKAVATAAEDAIKRNKPERPPGDTPELNQ